MKKIVLIHGMSSTLDECFGIEIKKRLKNNDFEIFEPIFPLDNEVSYQSWNDSMDRIVKNVDKNTSFLCHSLGCLYIVRYLYRKKATCNTVICIAGGVCNKNEIVGENKERLKEFIPNEKEFEYFKKNAVKVYDIISNNDHIFSSSQLKNYIISTNAEEIFLKDQGHFGRSSNVKDIPEIENILKNIH